MKWRQTAALITVVLAIGVVVALKATRVASPGAPVIPAAPVTLPRLVDLGSTTCIPCKKMAPILEELKTELAGKVGVEFIDINADAAAADRYKINIIPTQLFLDRDGKEVFRHEGFYPKADILAKLRELKLLAEG